VKSFSSGINFGSVAQSDARDVSRHIALWGGGTTGFGFGIIGGRINIVAAAAASNRIGFMAGTSTTAVAEVSNTGIHIPQAPTANDHAANKAYVDSRSGGVASAQVALVSGQEYVICTFGQNSAFDVAVTATWGGRTHVFNFVGTFTVTGGIGYGRITLGQQSEYGGKFFDYVYLSASPSYAIKVRAVATGTITLGRSGMVNGSALGGPLGQQNTGGTNYGGATV
jgi:hypothetical protein